MTVQVEFDVREPGSHLVRVSQKFPAASAAAAGPGGRDRTFRMAAWVPGSYKIRDFGRHVQDVEATVDGKPTKVAQAGKDAWTIAGGAGKKVELSFRVYCRELTVDTSHVTNDHAHLFPATLLLYDEASRGDSHRVTIRKPRGWSTYSGLETDAFDGTLRAADDYDHLIDSPLEIGPAEDYWVGEFSVRRKKHRVVLWKPPADMDGARITKDVRAVVDETCRLFGGAPYPHYTFLGHVAVAHGGGLEHRESTVLGMDPLDLVVDEKITDRFLPLVAHEFFHTWNVKRILPAAFTPYNLQDETYTGLLWLFEGFTTYYELPILARAGVVDDEAWGRTAAHLLQYYEMALGRHHRSVADCSRLTWTLLYQANEHNVNRNVSYYTKGLFVGLCLDAELRRRGVKEGLDVVMRALWSEHGGALTGGDGLSEDGFGDLVEAATGEDVRRLLTRWTEGTSELPIDAAFRYLGWDVKREHKDPKKPLGLGIVFKPATAAGTFSGGTVIERIPEDSPAFTVLQPDDEVVAADGYKWSGDRVSALTNTRKEGDSVAISVFREGRLRTFDVPIRTLAKDKATIKVRKGDAAATRRRNAWLTRP